MPPGEIGRASSSEGWWSWVRYHFTLDNGASLPIIALVVLLLLVAVPAPRWKRIGPPLLLILIYPLMSALRFLYPADSIIPFACHEIGVFFLLVGLGRGVLVVVSAAVLERFGRPVSKISLDLMTVAIIFGAVLVVLHDIGVEAGALFTGSAVATAVLGFALRDTLGNLFAGLALQIERPFVLGDWIQYDDNAYHVGKVIEINWRATKVLTLDEAEVILPNGQLANAFIRNFTQPEPWSRRSVFVVAPYGEAPNHVRQIILAAIADSWGVLENPPPSVVTYDFKDRGVEYWVRFFTSEFGRRDRVDGEVRDRIWYALARHGIEIPVATHAVRLTTLPPPDTATDNALETRARHLARIDVFAVLPEERLRDLAAEARPCLFAEGEVIIRQGDAGETVYLVERGQVSVRAQAAIGSLEVTKLGPGAFFGEISLLTGAPRSATVVALSECMVLAVDKHALEPILRGHPEVAESMSRVLAERRGQMNSLLSNAPATPVQSHDLFDRIVQFFSQ